MTQQEETKFDKPSQLFVLWFIIWIIALVMLPPNYFNLYFFILGIIPVAGWFLIRPQRIGWFFRALFGLNGPDN
jgi:hypothetical protein